MLTTRHGMGHDQIREHNYDRAMAEEDTALMRAWELSAGDHTDSVIDELEPLIPILAAAGYVEADDYTWSFTPKGVARAEELEAQSSS
jgi:hypothetical protein